VAEEFGVPLFIQRIVDSGEEKVFASIGQTGDMDGIDDDKGVSPLQLRIAAMALLRHGSSMPLERRNQLMEVSGLLLPIYLFSSSFWTGICILVCWLYTSELQLKGFSLL
jgi:hypothetical protein